FTEPYKTVVWMSGGRCLGRYPGYRRTVQHSVSGEDGVRVLRQDEEFTRGSGYCLRAMGSYRGQLANNEEGPRGVAGAKKVTTQADIARRLQRGLLDFIDELQISFADIHEELNNTWFRPVELRKVRREPSQTQSVDDGRIRQIQTI